MAKEEEEDDGEVCTTCNIEKAMYFGMCAGCGLTCGEAARSALAEVKAAKRKAEAKAAKRKAAKEKAAKEEAKEKAEKAKKRKAAPGLGGGEEEAEARSPPHRQ